MFTPVIPQKGLKTAELVARQIRKTVLNGRLIEGDVLPAEPQLINTFRVSRPTLREAIRILEAEGLVAVMRGARGGARIKLPTAQWVARLTGFALQLKGGTLRDVYETRMLIEPPAARLAAEHHPEEASRALQKQVDREYDIIGLDEWGKVGKAVADFHQVLLEQCGNPALALVGLSLKSIVEHHQSLLNKARRGEDVKQRDRFIRYGFKSHQRLVDLISQGAAADAERHWRMHMLGAQEFWLVGMAARAVVEGME